MEADLNEITTDAPIAREFTIFDVLRIDAPILELAKIGPIFVNGAEKIRWPGRYIIYAASRYYAAQFTLGGRLLSVASHPYVYWGGDIDFRFALFRPEVRL